MHQPLTWNMGTMGNMVSRGDTDSSPGAQIIMALSTTDRCENIEPLGFPVVPEV